MESLFIHSRNKFSKTHLGKVKGLLISHGGKCGNKCKYGRVGRYKIKVNLNIHGHFSICLGIFVVKCYFIKTKYLLKRKLEHMQTPCDIIKVMATNHYSQCFLFLEYFYFSFLF